MVVETEVGTGGSADCPRAVVYPHPRRARMRRVRFMGFVGVLREKEN
jgi:hypothetical protein